MGSYLSIVNNTEGHWTCKIGPDEAALKIAGIIISVIGRLRRLHERPRNSGSCGGHRQLRGLGHRRRVWIRHRRRERRERQPGQGRVPDHRAGREAPVGQDKSVALAAGHVRPHHHCGREDVTTDTLYMRPIFSGATDNSNNDHEVQFWIDKFGLETETVTASPEQQQSARALEVQEGAQRIYFYANGTTSYGP
ncbi:hypothetical protein PHYPSEUDO_012354 [Phytophthora pseudosyringae]|uniref:Uncharacterized protein n=1 Tax=Phytophthora pseudosyringae TaxID=221518 RepID=A0A8T1V7M7_9STRA|nr:hypothetical protein PHYPSEUDO_012354 [Phytophthora pseudosyringae]